MKRLTCPFSLVVLFALALAAPAEASSIPSLPRHGVSFSTGNKFLQHHDVALAGPDSHLRFTRSYNSQSTDISILGHGWTFSLGDRISFEGTVAVCKRADGHIIRLPSAGTDVWSNQTGRKLVLTKTATGYTLTEADTSVRLFDANGQLLEKRDRSNNSLTITYENALPRTIADNFGHVLTLQYNANNLLDALTTPLGLFRYDYDHENNLVAVTRPDGKIVRYLYQDPADPHNLTGIIDETGTRTQTIGYGTNDRVVSSSLVNGSDAVAIEYLPGYKRVVTDALGTATTYQLAVQDGVARIKSFTGPGCASCGSDSGASYVYDARQQVTSMTDAKGVVTTFTHDARGNRLTETEASGTALARTTTTTYTAQNQAAAITRPSVGSPGKNQVTSHTYDARGNLLTRTVSGFAGATAVSATTSFSYNELGQIIAIDGPRTDVNDITTLAYYPNDPAEGSNRGQLRTVTNALGHATTCSDYTPQGRPGRITGSDGLVTTLTYTFRGDVLTRTTGGLTTSYSHDDAGRLLCVTLPGGRSLAYAYSGDRVASITDGLGNRISYSYDAKGQRTGEEVRNPEGNLTHTLGLAYDAAGNLISRAWAGDAQETSTHDAVRNLVQTIDPTGMRTDFTHDALRRLQGVTEAGTALASYTYDSQDNPVSVTDARGHVTRFTYDDLGNRLSVTSPDAGTTRMSYDPAGNLVSRTDAGNRTTTFAYDALNRHLRQSVPGAARDIVFTYDADVPGRLASVQEETSNRGFSYNSLGQLIGETRTIGSTTANVGYNYDAATGDLSAITYPSGRVLRYSQDAAGRISGLQWDGAPLASGITHLPFGPMRSAQLGTLNLAKTFDQRYQLSRIQAGTLEYNYTRDAAGQVTGITGLPTPTTTGVAETATINPANNQISGISGASASSWSYDANGNLVSDGSRTFVWDGLNRLVRVEQDGTVVASYSYDSQNRRISKTVGGQTILYHYDLDSLLIAETLADGTPLRDYLYLDGESLALREYQTNPGLYYYLNDHLGTPQQLVKPDGTVVWSAAYLPYGEAQVKVGTVTEVAPEI